MDKRDDSVLSYRLYCRNEYLLSYRHNGEKEEIMRRLITKDFAKRIQDERSVDTRNYRYILRGDGHVMQIALNKLSTTASLPESDWTDLGLISELI